MSLLRSFQVCSAVWRVLCLWTATGYKATIDPAAFTVARDKLYLNYSEAIRSRWLSDIPSYVQKADANWSEVQNQTKGAGITGYSSRIVSIRQYHNQEVFNEEEDDDLNCGGRMGDVRKRLFLCQRDGDDGR